MFNKENLSNLTAEQLLECIFLILWAKDSLEFLIKQEGFNKDTSSAPELVNKINKFLNEEN